MSDINESQDLAVAPTAEDAAASKKKGLWLRGREALTNFRSWLAGLTRRQRLLAMIAAVAAALLIVLSILAWYLIFRKPLTELPGLNLNVPPAYTYSIANVSRPLGVAVDEPNGRIYVTQTDGARTVAVFDLSGNALGQLVPTDSNALHTPTYVAVDPTTSNVYVTDRGSNQIYVYDKSGRYLDIFKPFGVKTWGPLGITIDSAGLIYVSDVSITPHRVYVIKADGTIVRTVGVTAGLDYPNGLAIMDNGSLVVTDSNNARILVFDSKGELVGGLARGEADSPMGLPRGVATGAKGALYIVDTVNCVVRVYRNDNTGLASYATSFGEPGQGDGQFSYPNGITTDTHGHIYVTDRENNRLQVWTNR